MKNNKINSIYLDIKKKIKTTEKKKKKQNIPKALTSV